MELYGNPSSTHSLGRAAKAAYDRARGQIAGLVGASASEMVMVSCGTESINYALRGAAVTAAKAAKAAKAGTAEGGGDGGWRGHVITSAVEHVAVLETVKYLEREHGFDATVVGVDATGMVSVEEVAAAVTPPTVIVSIMHANNEVGTLNPIAEIAAAIKAVNPATLVHCDASQRWVRVASPLANLPSHHQARHDSPPRYHHHPNIAPQPRCRHRRRRRRRLPSLGKVPVDVNAFGVDYLTLAGHKLYAPKVCMCLGSLRAARPLAQTTPID